MNNRFSIVFTLFLLLSSTACGQVLQKTKYFKIENGEKKVFYPGIMGAPINTTYTFKLIAKKSFHLGLDSFWADGMADKVQVAHSSGIVFNGNVLKGDTLLITCTWLKSTVQEGYVSEYQGLNSSPETKSVQEHKGKLLFRYKLNRKNTLFFSVKDIKEQEPVYAP